MPPQFARWAVFGCSSAEFVLQVWFCLHTGDSDGQASGCQVGRTLCSCECNISGTEGISADFGTNVHLDSSEHNVLQKHIIEHLYSGTGERLWSYFTCSDPDSVVLMLAVEIVSAAGLNFRSETSSCSVRIRFIHWTCERRRGLTLTDTQQQHGLMVWLILIFRWLFLHHVMKLISPLSLSEDRMSVMTSIHQEILVILFTRLHCMWNESGQTFRFSCESFSISSVCCSVNSL